MPWPSYSRWPIEDVDAVWEYLRSLKPVAHAVEASRLAARPAGTDVAGGSEALYGAYCAACHGVNGAGTPFTTVPLNTVARDLDDESLTLAIAEGVPGTSMPSFDKTLTRIQIRELAATIRRW
jgi:mono/diheme cytochrome c family protein